MKETSKIIGGLVLAFLLATTGTGLGQKTAANQGAFASINITETPVQAEPLSLSASDLPSLRSLSDAQLETFMNALDATPTIAFDALPRKGLIGTFYSLQHPDWPPLPGDTSRSPVWNMGDFYLISDVNFNYDAPQKGSLKSGGSMRAMSMDVSGPPGFGDGGDGTNTFISYGSSYTAPDYGTNLWIAQVALASGYLTGIASNTLADVQYELQYVNDLTQTNWLSTGLFISGSETTNWTPLTALPVSLTNNFFIRLRSWADGGSGLPIWWQLQYFGTNGVDPYGNPKGDGWSNLQKFQNGWNPYTFYTPAAPQGLTVNYNANNATATLNWLPAAGNVTNYTVEKTYTYIFSTSVQDSTVSAGTTTFANSVATNQPDPWHSGNIMVSYTVRANYSGGNSAVSARVPLEAPSFAGSITAGVQGSPVLTVAAMPANTTGIRLTEIGESAFFITNFTVSISNFTNGICALPNVAAPTNYNQYFWVGQAIGADGSLSAAAYLNQDYFLAGVFNGAGNTIINSMTMPFYDGRVQLKQNLIFQLRAAALDAPLHFSIPRTNNSDYGVFGAYVGDYLYSTNYAYAGWYQFADSTAYNYGTFDPFLPFEENCLFRNFVFAPADATAAGGLTTGVNSGDYSPYDFGDYITLDLPLTYQFQINSPSFQALLATNNTRWLFYDQSNPDDSVLGVGLITYDSSQRTISMTGNMRNWFGLPYESALLACSDDSGTVLVTNILQAGTTFAVPDDLFFGMHAIVYPKTAQPQFQTVEYDFWNPKDGYWGYQTNVQGIHAYWIPLEPLPGQSGFSPTNAGNQRLMVAVGNSTQIAGYAKLAVQNGYSGAYGYLGQYFDKAYKMDDHGNVTTNLTGVVSPYGNYFATEVGAAAVVTMPDVDTGQRGTCMVYSVALQLDVNHDGNMDLSFNGADKASFTFWANNNYDRLLYDADDATNYEDDLDSIDVAKLPVYQRVPDCNYTNFAGYRAIPTKRDLQDFTRLWVCGVTSNLLAALPSGSTVTLSWGDVGSPNSGNPTIDLFQVADANGGIGYLTNATSAAAQTNLTQGQYVGRLGPGSSLQLNSPFFPNLWAGDRFIWCGVARGSGSLTLTIADAHSNVLAQSTAGIQIKDIKEMYERWTVGDDASKAPATTAYLAANDLPNAAPAFQYSTPQDTNTPYILFVHGWNMRTDDKDHFAETAFKRLYWQGYQGRFGSFRWPTGNGITGTASAVIHHKNFDDSEFNAWQSGTGLKNMLTRLNILYPGNAYLMAHSMGNVVAGEALKLVGNNQLVNTYVAMQGAVASHAYDPTRPVRSLLSQDNYTPNRYAVYYTNGAPSYFNGSAGAGTYVNFFNTNDFALSKDLWQYDQNLKPDNGWGYDTINNRFFRGTVLTMTLNFPADTYEIFSYCDEARCYALGAQADVGGVFALAKQVELPSVWPPDSSGYTAHLWHSVEFRADSSLSFLFWDTFLKTCKLKQP